MEEFTKGSHKKKASNKLEAERISTKKISIKVPSTHFQKQNERKFTAITSKLFMTREQLLKVPRISVHNNTRYTRIHKHQTHSTDTESYQWSSHCRPLKTTSWISNETWDANWCPSYFTHPEAANKSRGTHCPSFSPRNLTWPDEHSFTSCLDRVSIRIPSRDLSLEPF